MTDPTARYCNDLLVALRMADVPGPRIGEVLTEVRGHLAESGEDPVEAFGAPEEYAAALAGDRALTAPAERLRSGLTGAAFTLGGWWLADGATTLATGGPAELGPVPLVAAALAAAAAPWALEQLVSRSRARLARGVLAIAAAVAALTALGLLLNDRVGWAVPAPVPLVLGLALLVLGSLALRGSADPVVDPFDPPAVVQAHRRRDGALVNAVLWAWLLFLVALAVGAAVLADRLG
ncbi:HAAS signaling domain-containing protein [Modestobacter lapidis]|nr:hypothetical protein [Modestobacter lapidis]